MSTRNRKSPQNWIQVYCIVIFRQKRHCLKQKRSQWRSMLIPQLFWKMYDSKSCSILGLKSPYTRGQQRTDHYSTFIIILVIMVIYHFTDLCFKNWNRQLFFKSFRCFNYYRANNAFMSFITLMTVLRMLTIALNVPKYADKGVI